MPDYTIAELYHALLRANFSPEAARTMAAVSLAENSRRQLRERNYSTIEDSWGPFQINLRAHPQYTVEQVTTLDSAARAAKEIYDDAHGFSPWTMFTNGTYLSFLPSIDFTMPEVFATAIQNSFNNGSALPNLNPGSAVTSAVSDALKPLFAIITTPVNLLVKILTFLTTEKHYWQIGFILAGLGLIGLGTAVFFKNDIESVGRTAAKAVA